MIPTAEQEITRLEDHASKLTLEIAEANGSKDTHKVIHLCEQRADCRKAISKLRVWNLARLNTPTNPKMKVNRHEHAYEAQS